MTKNIGFGDSADILTDVVNYILSDLPDQAQQLVDVMKSDGRVDISSDWKLITVYMGRNDLCWMCAEHVSNCWLSTGLIPGLYPANERRRYFCNDSSHWLAQA